MLDYGPIFSRPHAGPSLRQGKKIDLDAWKGTLTNPHKRGRKSLDLRATLDGMWWILRTGSQWNQLPKRYGKANSVYRQHYRWAKSGMWKFVLQRLAEECSDGSIQSVDATHVKAHQDACRHGSPPEDQGLGKTKGGRNTKLHAVVDSLGKLLNIKVVPGNEHEVKSAAEVLGEELDGVIVNGDKGYVSSELAAHILCAGGIPNIPPKKGAADPLPYHKELGKLRHVVENFFCRIKRCRRVATRYDRLECTYLAFVTLAAIDDWIRF